MAVKKIKFDKEGFVSEEVIDRPDRQAPPPESKPRPQRKKKATSVHVERPDVDDDVPEKSNLSIKGRDTEPSPAHAGKSVLDESVIKFRCPRCGSERVVDNKDVRVVCGLCGAEMNLVS